MNKKHEFDIPNGIIYLDGNSLGPLPKSSRLVLDLALKNEWGEMLITAWNRAGWIDLPTKVGDLIAPIVGASAGTITTGDTLSIKMMQALHAGLQLCPDRKVVLSDNGNFPTDIYMAKGLLDTIGGYELRVVDPGKIEHALNDDVAVLMLTHVDYRTGKMYDMKDLTDKAHLNGSIVLWDLAHSVGAVEVELENWNVDFAAGCTYKFLNGGPGSPAFIYAKPSLIGQIKPFMSGWMGHVSPFSFDLDYRPTPGIERMRVGTPPILQLKVLESALKLFSGVKMNEVREISVKLSSLLIDLLDDIPELKLSTPRESKFRGSQVSYSHPHAYQIVQAMIDEGVIGDFRAPDIMRFGITPLYINEQDIRNAAETLRSILKNKTWVMPS